MVRRSSPSRRHLLTRLVRAGWVSRRTLRRLRRALAACSERLHYYRMPEEPVWRGLEALEPRMLLSATPFVDPIDDHSTTESQAIYVSASYDDADNHGDTDRTNDDTHTVQIDWGDGTVQTVYDSEPYTYEPYPGYLYDRSGHFNGSHEYADDGSYTVVVTVKDNHGDWDNESFTTTVSNEPPTLEVSSDSSPEAGSTFTLDLSSSDPGDDTISEWTIDWGDGNTETVSGNPSSVDHVYASDGSYTIQASATDEDGTYSADPLDVQVGNVAPTLDPIYNRTASEDYPVSVSATFDDANANDTHTATINWGDGTVESAYIYYEPYDGQYYSRPGRLGKSHQYADDGSYTVMVTVEDGDGASDSQSLTMTVNNTPPSVDISGDSSALKGETYTLNLSASDPGDDTISQWTIDWGDGNSETVSGNPSSVDHVYASGGSYTIQASATDEDGTYDAYPLDVQVNANSAPVIDPISDQTAAEADTFQLSAPFNDSNAGDTHTATINWGDGTVDSNATVDEPNHGYNPQPGRIEGSHQYADNGSYTVMVSVEDAAGETDTASFLLTVGNVAPTLSVSGDGYVDGGQARTYQFSASDPGDDTISEWTIDWGDGHTETVSGPSPSVEHVYENFGDANATYAIQATATDEDGTHGADPFNVTVTPSPLPVPGDLTAASVNGYGIELTWTDNSSRESGFRVQWSPNGTYWYTQNTTEADATSFTVPGSYDPSTTHYFRIRAEGSGSVPDSDYTPELSVTTGAYPFAPDGLWSTAVSDTRIDLTWDEVSSESGYRVYRSLDQQTWTQIGTTAVDDTAFSDTGLSEGTRYYYRVAAYNGAGESAYSYTRSETTHAAAPSGLTATVQSATAIDLSWSDNSSAENGYRIEQSLDGGYWSYVDTADADATSYTAPGPFDGSATYEFRVRAESYDGDSDYSNVASVATPAFPNAPTGVSVATVSDTQLEVTWDDVANEDGYRVERSTDEQTWNAVATVGPAVHSFTDSGLSEDSRYYYRVIATNAEGDSAPSQSRYGDTELTAPSGLVATPQSAVAAQLSWSDNSASEDSYRIERSLDGSYWDYVDTTGANATSFTDPGPFNGSTTYYYRVRAQGGDYYEGSAYTAVASMTTGAFPDRPTGLTAEALSDTEVRLTWSDVASEDDYRVERSTDEQTWVQVATPAADATSFTDTGLSEDTRYYYRVQAQNAEGGSAYSDTRYVDTRLTAPTALAVSPQSATATDLTWSDNSAAEDGYRIERSLDGSSWSYVDTADANATSFTDPGPFNGSTTYYYRVRAEGGDYYEDSNYSTVASATTGAFPDAPENLSAQGISDTQVELSWDDVADEDGYRVERSVDEQSWSTVATMGAGVVSFTDSGLSEDSRYYYRVVATSADGDSAPSQSRYADTELTAPSGLAATSQSAIATQLSWSDNSASEDGYRIERSLDGNSWDYVDSTNAGATSYTDAGPFDGSTTYYYRVRAQGGDYYEGSAYSAVISVTTGAFPDRPTGLAVQALSDTELQLTWSDVASEDGYRIERSSDGQSWSQLATVSADETSYTDTGLSEDTRYHYRVQAYNSGGDSAYSAAEYAETQLAAPTGLAAVAQSATAIDLTWADNSSSETRYRVEQSQDGTNWSYVTTTDADATSYTAPGPFEPSTTYQFRVRAEGGNYYEASDYATASVATAAYPHRPTGLTAQTLSDTQVELAWSDVADEDGYRVERSVDEQAWTSVATVGAGVVSFTDNGLSEDSRYYYRIVATNAEGDSAPSQTRSADTELTAPSSLAGTPQSAIATQLSWSDNSSSEDGYRIERSLDGSSWGYVDTADANATSFTDAGPFDGSTTYYYRIRAEGGDYYEDSAYSAAISVTTGAFPDRPTGLAVQTLSATELQLTWSDVASEDGYRIERSPDGQSWAPLATVAADATSYTDTGLSEDTRYHYRVQAYNAEGDSAYSESDYADTRLAAPTALTVAPQSATATDLTWSDNSSAETGYRIERSPDGSNWDYVATTDAGATSFTDPGPFDGSTTYYYRVRAEGGEDSNYSSVASATTGAFPNAPDNLNAQSLSDTQIELTWSDVANEDGYRVERSPDGQAWGTVATLGAGAVTFTDTGLSEGTRYHYRIIASNAEGDSAPSDALQHATQVAAPSDLTAAFQSATAIDLSWTDNSSVENDFRIERSSDGGASWINVDWVNEDTTAFTDTGPFEPSTTYQYRVRAEGYPGENSDFSNTASVATPAYPHPPTALTATSPSATEIELTWSDVPDEAGYRVERSSDGGQTWTTAGTTGADATSFLDSGLTDATEYRYRVIATNTEGDSAPSDTVDQRTRLAAPSGLAAVAKSGNAIDLTWSDNSSGESAYIIEQSPDGSSGWQQIGTTNADATSFTAPGPFEPSTTYHFRVKADGSYYGDSGYSNTASATTAAFPEAPISVSLTSLSTSAVGLNWDDNSGETGYRIFRRDGESGAWTEIGTTGADATAFTDGSVASGSSYTYGITALNAAGTSARAEFGPVAPMDGSGDAGDDGLNNLNEYNAGTDPSYFDSDGDLLSDGWESEYGFDPTDGDENDNGTTDSQDDSDDDNLNNLDESNQDTDPTNDDTDGDGASDGDEAAQGSDPNDASDNGEAPADDMKGRFTLTVGDPSGSNSERWKIELDDSGDRSGDYSTDFAAPGFGQVDSDEFWFQAGESYDIRLEHLGTDPDYLDSHGGPNYDWTAGVTQADTSLPYWINDEGDLLRTQIDGTIGPPNETAGQVSYFHIPLLDADVDSDNNDGLGTPERSDEEDRLEQSDTLGKYVLVNTDDLDDDGVPDFADFSGVSGGQFVPLVLSLSSNVAAANPEQVEYTFSYNASDPSGVPPDGAPNPGMLRLWKSDASANRSETGDPDGDGTMELVDYIEPGAAISAEELGLQPGGELTLYVEAVRGASSTLPISITANVSGEEWSGELSDMLHVRPVDGDVNSTSDTGDADLEDGIPWTGEINADGEIEVTLRAAIEQANHNPGEQDIEFDIPESDPGYTGGNWNIGVGSPISITDPVSIEGESQNGGMIILDGAGTAIDSTTGELSITSLKFVGFTKGIVHAAGDGTTTVSGNIFDTVDVGLDVASSGALDMTITDNDFTGVQNVAIRGNFSSSASGTWNLTGTQFGGNVGLEIQGNFGGTITSGAGTTFSSDTGIQVAGSATIEDTALFDIDKTEFLGVKGFVLEGNFNGGAIKLRDGRIDVDEVGIEISGSWENTPLLELKNMELLGLRGISITSQLNSGQFVIGEQTQIKSDTGVFLKAAASIEDQVIFDIDKTDFLGVKGFVLEGNLNGGAIKLRDGRIDVDEVGVEISGSWENTPLLELKNMELLGLRGISITSQLNSGQFVIGEQTQIKSDTGVFLQAAASIEDQVIFDIDQTDFLGLYGMRLMGKVNGAELKLNDTTLDVEGIGIEIGGTWDQTPLLQLENVVFLGLEGIQFDSYIKSGNFKFGTPNLLGDSGVAFNSDTGTRFTSNARIGIGASITYKDADFGGITGLNFDAGAMIEGVFTVDGAHVALGADYLVQGSLNLEDQVLFHIKNVTDNSTYGFKGTLSGQGTLKVSGGTHQNTETALDIDLTPSFTGYVDIFSGEFLGMDTALSVHASASATVEVSNSGFTDIGDTVAKITQGSAAAGFDLTFNGSTIDGNNVTNNGILLDSHSAANINFSNNNVQELLGDAMNVSSSGFSPGETFSATISGNVVQDVEDGFKGNIVGSGTYTFYSSDNLFSNGTGNGYDIEAYVELGGEVEFWDDGSEVDGFLGTGLRIFGGSGKEKAYLNLGGFISTNNGEGGAFIGVKAPFSIYNSDFSNNAGVGMVIGDRTNLHVEGTTIQGNDGVGVRVEGGGLLDLGSSVISGNASHGIQVLFGGSGILSGNDLVGNGGAGARIHTGGGVDMQGNYFASNTGLPVDIGESGETANDPDDADQGLQNYPEINTATALSNGDLEVKYRVDSTTQNSTYPLTVRFFKVSSIDGSLSYVGEDTYGSADAQSYKTVVFAPEEALSAGDTLLAIAIDDVDLISEFSDPITVV